MAGYDPKFLNNITLPLPTFRPTIAGNVVRGAELRDGYIADYENYSVVTDKVRRAPIVAAANIDVGLLKQCDGSSSWKIDSRIGGTYQLNNDYYYENPWDKGHQAMRESAGWGATQQMAQRGSDDTYYYSNASLQHENFNPDEWFELETWVNHLDGRVTCFTGPIYGQYSRGIRPPGRPEAEVPSAFFKVVCFLHRETKALAVRAFIVYQDDEALKDRVGRRTFNLQRYQVTVKEIEELTGLEFADEIYELNPLLYREDPTNSAGLNITSFPERVEVDRKGEIIDPGQPRVKYMDDEVNVYIAAALIDPAGTDAGSEWVSILNLENEAVPLAGWTLKDQAGRVGNCDNVTLQPGEAVSVKNLGKVQLTNTGGFIELYRKDERIDRVAYTEADVKQSKNKPIVFAYRTEW